MLRSPPGDQAGQSVVEQCKPSITVKEENSSAAPFDTNSKNNSFVQNYAKGMCRCCLLEGKFESMETNNIPTGFTQSYIEILHTTLGLSLSSTQGPRLICSSCAIQLRQAFSFRTQVVTAEKAFIAQYMLAVKIEANNTEYAKFDKTSEATASTNIEPKYIKPDVDDEKVMICLDDDNFNEDIPLSAYSLMKSCANATINILKNDTDNEDGVNADHNEINEGAIESIDFLDIEDKKFEECDICKERHAPDNYPQCKLCKHVFLNMRDKVYHSKCNSKKCSFCNDNFHNYNNKHNHHMKYCKYITCLRKRLQTAVVDVKESADSMARTEQLQLQSIKLLTGKLYSCEICKADHTFDELKEKHANYQKYTCTLCKVLFCDEIKKERHSQNHHIHCHLCDIIFPTPKKKKSHMTSKHGFKCVICADRIVGTPKEKHNSDLHGAKLYHCGICNRNFFLEHMLIKHQRMVHMKEKNIKCPKCDLEFYSGYYLAKHMVRHYKKKTYQCEYCSKKFCRKNTLQFHIRIHTGDRRAICKICGEAFVQRASLKYHLEKYHPGDFY